MLFSRGSNASETAADVRLRSARRVHFAQGSVRRTPRRAGGGGLTVADSPCSYGSNKNEKEPTPCDPPHNSHAAHGQPRVSQRHEARPECPSAPAAFDGGSADTPANAEPRTQPRRAPAPGVATVVSAMSDLGLHAVDGRTADRLHADRRIHRPRPQLATRNSIHCGPG